MTEHLCYHCFQNKSEASAQCPNCKYDPKLDEGKYPLALPCGTILAGKYIIGHVLGQGGFGITYIALDYQTKQRVAVKEYFPDGMVTRTAPQTVSAYSGQRQENFAYGKACFLEEAETLAKFIGDSGIIRVYSYFEENGTAYYVMEYVEGESLQQYVRSHNGKISWDEVQRFLFPVMDALGAVHAKGIVHRDVTPDNIYITKDGHVKLLDFGAARYSLGEKSRSLDVIIKHGFAPVEQYTRRGRQGPYTDVYSLGATMYYVLSGKIPPDSIDRMEEDDLIDLSTLGVDIPEGVEDAIMKAMALRHNERFQTMQDFLQALKNNIVTPSPIQPVQPKVTNIREFSQPPAPQTTTQQPMISQTQPHSNIENLLKRGFLSLEMEKWQEADSFFEQVLNENVEEYRAYIGKLCAEYRLDHEEKLAELTKDFTVSDNYKLACRFGGAEVEQRLDNYIKQNLYDTASRMMEKAASIKDFQEIEKRFAALGNYINSTLYAEKCRQKIIEIQEKEAHDKKLSLYHDAKQAMLSARTSDDFRMVGKRFAALGDFDDSVQKAAECFSKAKAAQMTEEYSRKLDLYNAAKQAMLSARTLAAFLDAEKKFIALGDFNNSEKMAEECAKLAKEAQERDAYDRNVSDYLSAERLMKNGDLALAAEKFHTLSGFKNADELQKQCLEMMQEVEEKEKTKRQRKQKTIKVIKKVPTIIKSFTLGLFKKIVSIFTSGKFRKQLVIIGCSTIVLGIFILAAIFIIVPNNMKYDKATKLYQDGHYTEALQAFSELEDYKDAPNMVKEVKYVSAVKNYENGDYEKAVKEFSEIADYKDASSILTEVKYEAAIQLYENGYYTEAKRSFSELGNYKDSHKKLIQSMSTTTLSAKWDHTVGLKSDGTVIAVGDNSSRQCAVSNWKDIVAISTGDVHTVGLRADGKVLMVGYTGNGRMQINKWTEIVGVSAGNGFTLGLKSDGTVVAAGNNDDGQCNVSEWEDIVAVSAGMRHSVGLKSDGTVVAVGSRTYRRCGVSRWNDIVAIAAGVQHTVGLKSDGTVVASGNNWEGQCEVTEWNDIVAIAAGLEHTVGLKSDGTVAAVGSNLKGQCNVSSWKDIVAISAGDNHTVGLKSDGTVVATGENSKGQCNVSDWKDLKTPKQLYGH